MKFHLDFKSLYSRKCTWKKRLWNSVHLSRPQCLKGSEQEKQDTVIGMRPWNINSWSAIRFCKISTTMFDDEGQRYLVENMSDFVVHTVPAENCSLQEHLQAQWWTIWGCVFSEVSQHHVILCWSKSKMACDRKIMLQAGLSQICVIELGHPNQCRLIVNWTPRNKIQWNLIKTQTFLLKKGLLC